MARTWIIAGPIGLITLGIGWIIGLIATPVVAIVTSNNKKKTLLEAANYTNTLPLGVLNMGDNVKLCTLTNIGCRPQLKIVIKNLKTNEQDLLVY